MTAPPLTVRACVVGGGPAGIMLSFLLARAGYEVAVLEKHGDFLRDFRGDTVHPSTMTVLDELGLLDDFLKRPHSQIAQLDGHIGEDTVTIADFNHIPAKTKFLAIMPQWDFLNFLVEKGKAFDGFRVLMNTEATDVIRESGRIAGVRANAPNGPIEIRADVVVACDGRHSTLRAATSVTPRDLGAPMDVLWMRISRHESDPYAALGYVGAGAFLVLINRDDYWQCGFVIAKGTADQLRARGIEAFRAQMVSIAPFLADRVNQIASWDDVKLLTVAVQRLDCWYLSGMLFIGDAAHAMSPIGGVGINLAIQDAVATANVLSRALQQPGPVSNEALIAVQRRRMFPTVMTQGLQVFIQRFGVSKILQLKAAPKRAPLALHVLTSIPGFQYIPAYLVGIGFRPEHLNIGDCAR
jgi:2-polyprenyl-6-methoxyphenol hydroxylase-like FAD-dependent oxidoreductase